MKEYDVIELICDDVKLNEKGIYKGSNAVLISFLSELRDWIVMFLNPKNLGDFAVAVVNEKYLKFVGELPEQAVAQYKIIVNRPDFFEHTEFMRLKFKEYDKVALSIDKPKYLKEGVKKGMIGCIMSYQAINGEHQVIFSQDNTCKDIGDIMVLEEDLIGIE